MDKTYCILVGAPGAGKNTLVKHGFNGHIDHGYIEMGEVMRNEAKLGTHLGLQIKEYQDALKMVPDDITMTIAEREISLNQSHHVLFSDGFPRTIGQVPAGINLAKKYGFTRFIVIHIHSSEATCIERIMAARRGRGDDGSEEKAEIRLDVFNKETLPIIAYLKSHLPEIGDDFITLSGENMKEKAQIFAESFAGLYDIPVQEKKVIDMEPTQIRVMASLTSGIAG